MGIEEIDYGNVVICDRCEGCVLLAHLTRQQAVVEAAIKLHATLPVADGRIKYCTRCETTPCPGCKHWLSKHRRYANGGRNRHGSTLVCTVDNCAWTECREPPAAGGE